MLIEKNNINGVSVDIINDPTPTIGSVSHIKEDNNWAIWFVVNSLAKKYKTIVVAPCSIGAKILTANSKSPNKYIDKLINHAINGGFEK